MSRNRFLLILRVLHLLVENLVENHLVENPSDIHY